MASPSSAMTTDQTRPRGAHLVGSLGFESAEEVFREVSEVLGDRVCRIPDGETGPRSTWVGWQQHALAGTPELDAVPAAPDEVPPVKYRVRPGIDPQSVDLGSLGYSAEATRSYAAFRRLRSEGVIGAGVRFQVCLPTPFAGLRIWVARDAREALAPAFARAMGTAVTEIAAAVPAEDLAIQWDVCLELGHWERPYANFSDRDPLDQETRRRTLRDLAELGDLVPRDVEVGYHLCYGDWDHRHFVEPRDTGNLVDIANGVSEAIRRPLDWMHLPVPRSRDDDAYFAPLTGLRLRPETELYLGLVHFTDGVEGTERRIRTARRFAGSFGVATECGMGRRPPAQMRELLGIHREVSAPR